MAASFAIGERADGAGATWTGDGDGMNWTNPDNWISNGVADMLPPDTAPGDDLTFGGGTVGTINLQGNEFANSLTFTAGFTLDPPPSTNTLTLSTASITVSTGISSTINAKIADTHGLTLSGGGTLMLNGANSVTGSTSVTGGTLVSENSSALGNGSTTVSSGAGLIFNANYTFNAIATNNGNLTVSSDETAAFSGFSSTFTQAGGQLTVNGVLNVGGSPFVYSGGNITGTVTMGSTSFAPTLTLDSTAGNSGTFALGGEGEALNSNTTTVSIQSSQTLLFAPSTSTASLSTTDVLVNAGTISVTGSSTSKAILTTSSSTTTVTSTITNTGTITTSVSSTPSSVADFIVGNISNTTGAVNINASTQVNGNINNGGNFDIANGQTLTLASSTESFTQSGGSLSISGVLSLPANNFTYSGGSITGTVSMGGAGDNPTLTLGSGAGNSGTFVFSGAGGSLSGTIPTGVTVTLQPTSSSGSLESTTGIANAGNLNIIGKSASTATLEVSGQAITNTGTLTTSATGTPTSVVDFVNNTLNNTTGTVNINASTQVEGNVANNGTFDIAASQTMSFENSGYTFTQNAGALTVSGVLSMVGGNFAYAGGSVTGTVNLGDSAAGSALTIDAGAGNSGTFAFLAPGGSLTGSIPSGVTVTLQATTESGSLTVTPGMVINGNLNLIDSTSQTATLTCGGTFTNSGILTASSTGTPSSPGDLISGVLANTSSGTVNVNASMEMLNNPISNNGTIDIATGQSLTLGSVSAEFKQFGGQINVAAGGVLNTTGSTIFLYNGTITLNADAATPGVFKPGFVEYSASTTTATVQSGPVGAGQSPGYVDLSGQTVDFAIGTGTEAEQLIVTAPITDGGLEKSGGGVMEISGANTYTGGTTVTNGTLLVAAANSIPTTNGITIETGGVVQLATDIGGVTTQFLSIDSSSQLNIANNHLFINYAGAADPISTIAGYLATGYAGGAWNGDGIMSSTVAVGYGIGYADSADAGNPAGLPTETIEIKYTLLGDATLQGLVNATDFGILAANFNKGVTGWDNGDFNYDNVVNGTDFADLASNFNKGASGASLGPSALSDPALVAFAEANGLMADVPEPASMALIVIGVANVLSRRRR